MVLRFPQAVDLFSLLPADDIQSNSKCFDNASGRDLRGQNGDASSVCVLQWKLVSPAPRNVSVWRQGKLLDEQPGCTSPNVSCSDGVYDTK